MTLPLVAPLLPMLAKRVSEFPDGDDWLFEPKWDGFRVLVFRDGDDVDIQSRDSKPLARYFPELVEMLRAQLPARCVLDGEIVIAHDGVLDFEALQMRLHPAATRVKLLAAQTPASAVFWDLLCVGDEDLTNVPFAERRARLETLLRDVKAPLQVTPATRDRGLAAEWFNRFEGAGLDGVMAKLGRGVYEPNKRVMLKIKHERECDCAVAGFRWHKSDEQKVGSLLLGLYDDGGQLHHVGVIGSFKDDVRRALVDELAPYRAQEGDAHPWHDWAQHDPATRVPGAQSRWSQGKDLSFVPLRPGARGRGGLRPHAGDAVPPYRAVPSLAPRQTSQRVLLRTARSGAARRVGKNFRMKGAS